MINLVELKYKLFPKNVWVRHCEFLYTSENDIIQNLR